jgi:PKD repeat protein
MKSALRRGRALAALGVTSALAASLVVAVPTAAQAVASVGFSGQVQGTFSGTLSALGTAPTATKTQHKVWYAGGTWWASMRNAGSTGYSIHRLDGRETGSPVWTDTNVVIDSRNGTSSDALYNASANKLFIASHVLTARNTEVVTANADAILTRYSLVDGSWVKDEGWPTTIVASRGLSSLSIAQLTDGKIMATYVYNRRPYATNTSATANGVNPATFVNNFVVRWTKNTALFADDVAATTLTGDDVSAITAADGYVTIVFSNQRTTLNSQVGDPTPAPGLYAARHRVSDSFGTGNFFGTQLAAGDLIADNHISLVTDPAGGSTSPVYAAVKTSNDAADPIDNGAPLLRVLKLQPRSGGTVLNSTNAGYVDVSDSATLTTVGDKGTRPVLSLDNTRRTLDVFYAVANAPSLTTNVIGVIKRVSVPISTFTPGAATVVAANSANSAGDTPSKPEGLSDPSVAAQILNSTSGTVVLATDTTVANLNANPLQITRRYWWNDLFRAPSAAFTAEIPVAGDNTAGLRVNFTDTSLGRPTSWAWNFGDGSPVDNSANPVHPYASGGAKTVSLTVNNGTGPASTITKTVNVGQPPVARFSGKAPNKQLLLLELTDLSTGAPDSVRWTFGDGTARTVTTPGAVVRHPYKKAGKYKVTLTATNGAGSTSVDHPTIKTTTFLFIVNATPNRVAKPSRLVPTGRKAIVSWKVPNARGLVITKYWVICRAPGSIKSVVVKAKDGTVQIGRVRKGTVVGLAAGKTYSCTVKAFNAKGWSLPSIPSTSFKARA